MARTSTSVCSAGLFSADLGEDSAMSESCATGTMAKEDTGVCTPDPLPDAVASLLIPRGEIAPARALCELVGECDPFLSTFDEVTAPGHPTPKRGKKPHHWSGAKARRLQLPPTRHMLPFRHCSRFPRTARFQHCHPSTSFGPAGCEGQLLSPARVACYSEEQAYG